MKIVPHDYQIDCMKFMLKRPCSGAFLDVGEGKTGITLGVVSVLKESGKFDGMLVVSTLKVITHEVWQKEIKKWGFDFTTTILHGKDKDKNLRKKRDIYLINYEGLHWLLENIKTLKASILILDESSKTKSFNTNRFKILKKIRYKFSRVHLLTATPSAQSYEDLFSQIYLLDEGERLGKFITHFRNKYFITTIRTNKDGTKSWPEISLMKGADKQIFKKIKDVIYRTDKDHLKIPKEIYNDVIITLPKRIKKRYNELERDYIAELDTGTVTAVHAGAKRNKLKQFCNGNVYDENRKVLHVHNEKINAALEIVEDLKGSPILIGYEYKHDLASLLIAFPKAPYFGTSLLGKKPTAAESLRIENLWNRGKIPVLLGQVSSVAHGLNLQKAGNNLMFYSHLDKLEDVIQFLGRVRRQGQKKRVIVHRLIIENSVDVDVIASQNAKMSSQKALLNAMRKRLKNN